MLSTIARVLESRIPVQCIGTSAVCLVIFESNIQVTTHVTSAVSCDSIDQTHPMKILSFAITASTHHPCVLASDGLLPLSMMQEKSHFDLSPRQSSLPLIRYQWTIPSDANNVGDGTDWSRRWHVLVRDSNARDSRGHSAPFFIHHSEGAAAAAATDSPSRAGQPVQMTEARVGLAVVRGPDWKYGNQDGGAGQRGVITEILMPGVVAVRWQNGHSNHCE